MTFLINNNFFLLQLISFAQQGVLHLVVLFVKGEEHIQQQKLYIQLLTQKTRRN